jgi:hypothetical protein
MQINPRRDSGRAGLAQDRAAARAGGSSGHAVRSRRRDNEGLDALLFTGAQPLRQAADHRSTFQG